MKKSRRIIWIYSCFNKFAKEIGMTKEGTADINELFDKKIFGFPKPVALLKFLISIATKFDKNSIILDFFSGSATTAHAVMQLNAEDGGNRKFICVHFRKRPTNRARHTKRDTKRFAKSAKSGSAEQERR